MSAATVSQLYRYPVKSMRGETRGSLEVTKIGVSGDRVWAVREKARGGIRGAKNIPTLMTVSARFSGAVNAQGASPVVITAADGSARETGSADINDWLSEKLHHAVTLWPLLSADALDHYRASDTGHADFETALRQIFGRAADASLPDLSPLFEMSAFESLPRTYYDACPIHLLTRQSLVSMAQLRGASNFRVDRFRPNIFLDAADSDQPFPEAQWLGQRIRIGEVELEVVGDCPRCAMVTHPFADLPGDPAIMRALVEVNQGNIGVYAKVVSGGVVNVGDALVLATR